MFISPEKKSCPWAKDAKDTNNKQDDHSLITEHKLLKWEQIEIY
jgi:hypothetical protein